MSSWFLRMEATTLVLASSAFGSAAALNRSVLTSSTRASFEIVFRSLLLKTGPSLRLARRRLPVAGTCFDTYELNDILATARTIVYFDTASDEHDYAEADLDDEDEPPTLPLPRLSKPRLPLSEILVPISPLSAAAMAWWWTRLPSRRNAPASCAETGTLWATLDIVVPWRLLRLGPRPSFSFVVATRLDGCVAVDAGKSSRSNIEPCQSVKSPRQ
ncbi:hypothetical protein V8F06_008645 [Rhypophila decipiens]